jgi:hypothetical protein
VKIGNLKIIKNFGSACGDMLVSVNLKHQWQAIKSWFLHKIEDKFVFGFLCYQLELVTSAI